MPLVIRKKQKSNTPFRVTCDKMLFTVPEGVQMIPCMSSDGYHYYTIWNSITGPEIVEVGLMIPRAYFYLMTVKAQGERHINLVFLYDKDKFIG